MSDRNTRKLSNWIHLRDFHNAIKYKLLESVVNYYDENGIKELSLLDVSVGKGGDIFKWENLGIKNAVGLDPSETSIRTANDRFTGLKKTPKYIFKKLNYTFIHTPANESAVTTDWSEKSPLLDQKLFDIVSCQMTLHYFFRSKEMLENAIKNVSDSLLPGGIFIGTAIDEKKLIQYRNNGVFEHYKNISQFDLEPINDRVKNVRGVNIHQPLILLNFRSKDKKGITPAYSLTWGDGEEVSNYMKKKDERSKDLDLDLEYLVGKKKLIDVCEKYNLYPIKIDGIKEFQPFQEWYERLVEKNEKINLWNKQKDLNLKQKGREHECLMSFMYESFAFIKRIDLMKEE